MSLDRGAWTEVATPTLLCLAGRRKSRFKPSQTHCWTRLACHSRKPITFAIDA
jgi:hypothetical protein